MAFDEYGDDMMQRRALLSQMRGGNDGVMGGRMPQLSREIGAQMRTPYEAPEPRASFGDGPEMGYAKFNPQTQTGAIPKPTGAFAGQTNPGGQTMPQQAGPKKYSGASGYDVGKLNDTAYHTPKYDLGRAIQDVGLNAFMDGSGQGRLQEMLRANPFYKDARVEGDNIFYTGQHGQPVTIDYIKGMKSGHPELGYLTSDHGGGAPAAAMDPLSGDGFAGSVVNGVMDSGLLARIQAEMAQHAQGQPQAQAPNMDQQALLELMQKGPNAPGMSRLM